MKESEYGVKIFIVLTYFFTYLRDERRSGARFIFPVWRQHALCFVVTCESVDSGFDQNKSEFVVFVLTITFQVLPDGYGLLNQIVKIFGQVGGLSVGFHDSQNLLAGDESDLSDSL